MEGSRVAYGFRSGDLRERDNFEDIVIDGRIILKWIFKMWDGEAGAGLMWLRMGTSGARF
jgi:hypothetical protein